VIPAYNESGRIAATIRAAKAIPGVDLVVVVDDGSSDQTSAQARQAGAEVVRHSRNRGKAAALETGAAVVAMRDGDHIAAKALLFLDADLGDSAAAASALVDPVANQEADFTVAVLPPQAGAGGMGLVLGLAKSGIKAATGFSARAPLSGQRCLTHQAFDQAVPLARGWGVEVAMTIDLLRHGLTIQEVDCDLRHRASGKSFRGTLHRAAQFRDVALALAGRGIRQTVASARRLIKPVAGGPRPPLRPH